MRKFLAALVVGITALAVSAIAFAATSPNTNQTVDVKVDPNRKSASRTSPRPSKLDVTTRLRSKDGSKHAPATKATVFFPRGMVFNPEDFPQCSKRALSERGPAACPSRSRVGGGWAKVDARPVIENSQPGGSKEIEAQVQAFNGQPKRIGSRRYPTIYLYATTTTPIATQNILEGVLRPATSPYGRKLEVTIPPLPTIPDQPNATISDFNTRICKGTYRANDPPASGAGPAYVCRTGRSGLVSISSGGRTTYYVTNPTTCNRTWPFKADFRYEGNLTASATDRVACRS